MNSINIKHMYVTNVKYCQLNIEWFSLHTRCMYTQFSVTDLISFNSYKDPLK